MTSPDGVTWTPQSTGVSNSRWYAVTYGEDGSGNGMFVAVSVINQGGTPQVMASPDGVTWTPRTDGVGTAQ